jgi:chromosome segregation ATPase
MKLLCSATPIAEMTKLTLELSPKFKVPALFVSGSTKEKEDALTLGAKILQLVQIETATQEIRAAVERKEAEFSAELSSVKTAYAESQEQLRQIQNVLEEVQQKSRLQIQEARSQEREAAMLEIQAKTNYAALTQEELQKLKQEFDAFQQRSRQELKDVEREARRKEREATLSELEAQLQKAQQIAETADERRRCLELTRDADIQAAEQRVKAMMTEVIRVREEQVKTTEGTLQSLQDAYAKQNEQLQALNDFLRRKITNGKAKGNEYELQFREILTRTFHIMDDFGLEDFLR